MSETTADFKARIAAMIPRDWDAESDRPCVRKPTDLGYYPPVKAGGSGQRGIKQNDSTGIVERPKQPKTTNTHP